MAYNSTSWTTDGLSKATNSTSTNDSLSIDGTLTVGGASTLTSTLTIGVNDTGHDVKFFGATSGSFMLWDESDDALELTDSSPIKIGDGGDMTIYHDGSNSYVTNATGALKIATEASGIAVSIGHTTSETTVNDNLTITGNVDIVSNSSTELNFSSGSGSDVANIYSDGNMLIKAAASKQINIGTNNQTDSVIIDSSENVTLQGTLQVNGNVIKASDGGNTITMDTSDNVTIAGDLTVTGGDINLSGEASQITLIDNTTGALQIGSDGNLDVIKVNTSDNSAVLQINGDRTGSAPIAITALDIEGSGILAENLDDGYVSSMSIDPLYSGNYTLTRHNYIKLEQPQLLGSAAITDACVFSFDANKGTHKAIDSGSAHPDIDTADAWMKININGTVHYIPCYTDKS
mgnify:CR=1 FL=1|tara:strand:+ start:949 stop:2160 length:1212 start_codon:yes stop_codon:yes gene_type:complete